MKMLLAGAIVAMVTWWQPEEQRQSTYAAAGRGEPQGAPSTPDPGSATLSVDEYNTELPTTWFTRHAVIGTYLVTFRYYQRPCLGDTDLFCCFR